MRDNKIDDEGGKMIVEGEWPSLKNIHLGISVCYFQTGTVYQKRSRNDYVKDFTTRTSRFHFDGALKIHHIITAHY